MALTGLVLGDNCIDRYLAPVDRDFVGGQAVNVAVNLARLGLEVAYAGVVGDDGAGAWILRELRARGVDVSAVERVRGSTGVTLIDPTPGRERRFIAEDYGVSAPYAPTRRALDLVRTARLVYAVHLADLGVVTEVLPPETWLAVDVSEDPPDRIALATTTVLFLSRPRLEPGVAMVEAQRLVSEGAGTVVLTLGSMGAVAAASAEAAYAPAAASVVVDTLGAGDALAATFLARRLAGDGLESALRMASEAAAEVCTHLGAYA